MTTCTEIRVLVVDDSVVVRRLVSDALAGDPAIKVVATASNGRIALARLEQIRVDLVTLDIEMPELDGLATLMAIRKRFPKLPVIMFSMMTARGAAATIDALSLGANDYVTKPEGAGNISAARERIKSELIPKIKALCAPGTIQIPVVGRESVIGGVTAVAIGVSTGGPPALECLVSMLPAALPVPIFIVQHMPPMFTSMLAKRLSHAGPLPVTEVVAPTRPLAGHIYLAPGDFHLVVERTATGVMMRTTKDAPECSCRPSVDVLFRSVAATYLGGCLGVVLTGMGSDGARGSEQIRKHGGSVIAQDQATSVVWGMPGAVVKLGLATTVVPIDAVAGEIARRTRVRKVAGVR